MQKLISIIDKSVNFVPPSMFESRFVQRTDDYFIAYLSSHNGCNKACRFCHLTQTKQTDFEHASLENYVTQLKPIISHYSEQILNGQPRANKINFNFMARGEPFANNTVLNDSTSLALALKNEIRHLDLKPNFNFSTIGPTELGNRAIADVLSPNTENVVYYSLYSARESFRKKWLPKSLPVDVMLSNMRDWQDKGGTNVLHWALIDGENDSLQDIDLIVDKVNKFGINARFNLVRYNPYSIGQGAEPGLDTINAYFEKISKMLGSIDSKIVSRVGFDVKASCGMFVS